MAISSIAYWPHQPVLFQTFPAVPPRRRIGNSYRNGNRANRCRYIIICRLHRKFSWQRRDPLANAIKAGGQVGRGRCWLSCWAEQGQDPGSVPASPLHRHWLILLSPLSRISRGKGQFSAAVQIACCDLGQNKAVARSGSRINRYFSRLLGPSSG